jgi:aspartate aminotransferase/aminotransferase
MHPWLAQRTDQFVGSEVRKIFDMASKIDDPINLSIGQPDFPAPAAMKRAAVDAIQSDRNGYSTTRGIPELRERLQAGVDAQYGHDHRRVMVTSGAGGALTLAIMAMVDPGDEVIVFDPYFLMYAAALSLAGGKMVTVDTYPDFRIDVDKVAAAITPRTKAIILNSPSNPTGAVAGAEEVRALAELAARHNIALISDEIYRLFSYGDSPASPAQWNPDTIVVDGLSKTAGVTGWRLGWLHGPAELVDKMATIQQYTFVCAPHPLQWGAVAALEVDMRAQVAAYARRRDLIVGGLHDLDYEVAGADGAFYVFPKVPAGRGTAHEFVTRAIEHKLLIIPGGAFSRRDTHIRISYAASEKTIERALEVLRKLRG